MGHGFGQHGLAAPWGAEHEDTARWVDANLLVEVRVGKGQLHGLPHLLLLDVHSTNVGVAHVRFLVWTVDYQQVNNVLVWIEDYYYLLNTLY